MKFPILAVILWSMPGWQTAAGQLPAASDAAQNGGGSTEVAAPTEENPEGTAATGTGPIDISKPDSSVRQTLEKLLPKYPGVRKVNVELENGIVTLTGHVENADTRTRVTDFVRRVQGVNLVLNQMKTDAQVMTAWRLLNKVLTDFWHSVSNRWLLALLALAVLVVAIGLAKLFMRHAQLLLLPFIGNPLLRSVAAPIIGAVIILLGLMVALQVLDLTRTVFSLLGLAGAVGLAISFAFRDITENFISSVLLGIRRPYRIGDMIEVAGHSGVVQTLNTRATVLMTLEGNHVRIPNSIVYKEILENKTASPTVRCQFDVVIPYETSTATAQGVINEALHTHKEVLPTPAPRTLVEALESGGVRLRVYYWIPIPGVDGLKLQSDVRLSVKAMLQKAGITPPPISMSLTVAGKVPVQMVRAGKAVGGESAPKLEENVLHDLRAATSPHAEAEEVDLTERVLKEEETVTSDEGANLLKNRNDA
ncbi:mechanosensitive ion channel family protein [Methylohalobius crimeensis]|uniref:mechanosensitive ion channel family protein n=1 Tax=Methylohalobius crimeensis TaxID=244365 RepID=UPI0003B417E2|nr:mechanosensitive ion channel family protein [Methylohalobius crimeensis]